MGKVLIIVLIAAVGWVGWTLHNEGTEKAFGGILAPIESVRDPESMGTVALTPLAQSADVPMDRGSDPGRTTQGVRDRLSRSTGQR
jgi:hypothetical protein